MDDQRVGGAIRALRRRRGWRQGDLSAASGVPQSTISEIERGHIDGTQIRTLRAVLAALDARGDIEVRWRGGALDRLLDERHARLVEGIVRALDAAGWRAVPELTYSRYGERGSIDVLGLHPAGRACLVVEVKSDITAVEATNRNFDAKIRLAPTIVREQFGYSPDAIGAALVLPEQRTARRRVADHAATFAARYPARSVDVRHWLKLPVGPLRAIWFLPDIAQDVPRRRIVTANRVVGPRERPASGSTVRILATNRP